MIPEELGIDPSCLPLPVRVVGHRDDEPEIRVDPLELEELVEKRGRLSIAVRVDQRYPVWKLLLDDVAEHAAKDRDADAAGDEHVWLVRLLREEERSLRLLDVDLGPDRQLDERALEGAVTDSRAEAEHPALVR